MKNQIEDIVKIIYDPKVEAVGFLILSGELGQTFFGIPKCKRKIEDYGKLIAICIVFEFRRTLLKLFKEGESKIEIILDYLREEGKKPEVVENWIKEAIENIIDPKLKTSAIEIWKEKKQKIREKDFDLAKML